MPASDTGFFPRPIELASLDPAKPNYRQLGEGVEVVVLVRAEGLSILKDLCPHMGAPMSEGKYRAGEGTLECPWHGYRYDARTGAFAGNPNEATFSCMKSLYKSYNPAKKPDYSLPVFAYELRGGLVHVRRPGAA